jgi:hypothetical protein
MTVQAQLTPTGLETSPLFCKWQDPVSGVSSYILSQHAAPFQQSFYFTTPSLGGDGRYLWFYCAFPPAGDAYSGRMLGVADLREQAVRYFPETAFSDASPWIDPQTSEAYWITGLELWKRGPRPGDEALKVNAFDAKVACHRRPLRIATHLTRSADGKRFNIDAEIGNEWIVGDIGTDSRKPLRIWQRFSRCHNHAQFSPTEPDTMLLAQDFWYDSATGRRGEAEDRLWLIRRGEAARPLLPNDPSPVRGHEWWDADGRHVYYIQYHCGTHRVDIDTGEVEIAWPGNQTHSHCDRTGRYFAGDFLGGPDPFRVAFFNRATGRAVDIVSGMPNPGDLPSRYHIHPHPQFCHGDRLICYTTTVRGSVELAFASVEELVRHTGV